MCRTRSVQYPRPAPLSSAALRRHRQHHHEATSALDYETERKVCDNLLGNLNDRTVFFITHRLSTIRQADMIVMLHQGAVVEVGTHDELINRRGRYYALYRQQESS